MDVATFGSSAALGHTSRQPRCTSSVPAHVPARTRSGHRSSPTPAAHCRRPLSSPLGDIELPWATISIMLAGGWTAADIRRAVAEHGHSR